jgi:hypothetical protein
MNGFFHQKHNTLHRISALVGVLLVMMLDILAASPLLHEEVCHHADHAADRNGQEHEHDCAGCVVTLFAAGQAQTSTPPLICPRTGEFRRCSAQRMERRTESASMPHLWPESNAPPAAA